MSSPLAVYAELLLAGGELPALARRRDGSTREALVERWRGVADEVDERALRAVDGPVLDIGCGPGRHLHALARRGVFGLGVDLSPVAVELARGGGGRAIVGSIFDELPGAGQWRGALLLDGNIGIGGCPQRLLTRVCDLLAPGGALLVELEPPGCASVETPIRLERGEAVSEWFRWAEVSVTDAPRYAAGAGLAMTGRWRHGDRWFALLRRPQRPSA